MKKAKTVIVIAGPTAVGKTAFAIDLAKLLQTEIISADSRQCYKELNIGVARPSPEELQQVKHHFINSHSIHEVVNAATFENYALNAVNEIFRISDVAVMVGGTGLYIKAFTEGMDEIPAIDDDIRENIIEAYAKNGLAWLQQEVQEKDPAFWSVAEQQNPQRLMRALEVKVATGKSVVDFRSGESRERPFNIIKIGLELPRDILYQRIDQRVAQMIAQGLEEEVRSLVSFRDLNALKTVGYKEMFDFFDGMISLPQAISDIQKHSRHYAKRQLTWFKKDAGMRWFTPLIPAETVLKTVLQDS